MFDRTDLPVPEIQLPNGLLFGSWPSKRDERLPILHPASKWLRVNGRWRAKKMQMVGHHHVASNQPMIGFGPAGQQQGMNIGPGENRLSAGSADGHQENDCAVMVFQRWEMRRMTLRTACRSHVENLPCGHPCCRRPALTWAGRSAAFGTDKAVPSTRRTSPSGGHRFVDASGRAMLGCSRSRDRRTPDSAAFGTDKAVPSTRRNRERRSTGGGRCGLMHPQ